MTTDHRHDWDAYWSGAGRAGVFSQFASGDVALKAIWSGVFADTFKGETPLRVLDLACGSGAVTAMSLEAAKSLYNSPIGQNFSIGR